MELTPRTLVLGDLHGQRRAAARVLERAGFRPEVDHLWLVGDLVNRGPDSLGVLRWARDLEARMGSRFVAVLGNHDLHLLALGDGYAEARPKDRDLEPVLVAPDREDLLDWLGGRPVLHRREGQVLVHAGLDPQWTWSDAEAWARRVETAMSDRARRQGLLTRQPPEDPVARDLWNALEIFTRVRTLDDAGRPCSFKGPPAEAPEGCRPWFEIDSVRGRQGSDPITVLFGHWAALGLFEGSGARCLDSGAAWGGPVTALCLEEGALYQAETKRQEVDPGRRS